MRSMPGIGDNALVKAARYLEALGAYEPPRELIPEAKGLLEATLTEMPPPSKRRSRGHAPSTRCSAISSSPCSRSRSRRR